MMPISDAIFEIECADDPQQYERAINTALFVMKSVEKMMNDIKEAKDD